MDDFGSGNGSARARLVNGVLLGVIQGLAQANQRQDAEPAPFSAGDVVLGLGAVALDATRLVTQTVGFVVRPVTARLAPPAAIIAGPSRLLRRLAQRGHAERQEAASRLESLGRRLAPGVVDRALGLVDLTDVVRDHVDLDSLVADVDIDAVAARIDLDAILERVDVDGIAARLDVDAVAARLGLDAVLERVDIDGIAARLDVDAVAARIDLKAILERVDVDAIAARLDLDAVVGRLDLIALAEFVVEGIDLPGIIQGSTGSMASEARREMRWQGISADERVAHVVDRVLRRQERHPGTPAGEPLRWEEALPAEGAAAPPADQDQPGQGPPAGGYGLAH